MRPGFIAGRRYAFILGIEEPGAARGFTLANANAAGVNAPPSLTDAHDFYHGGWGLRREGDGTLPPMMLPEVLPPDDPPQLAQLHREALFAEGSARYSLSPTTNGFPDVDTYRDLEFYLEAAGSSPGLVEHDLTPLQDAERALANPHKGWFHHYPDNKTAWREKTASGCIQCAYVDGRKHIVTSYLLVCGEAQRLPRALAGSNDGGESWTVLDGGRAGLFVCSGNTFATTTAEFDSVRMGPAESARSTLKP